MPIRRRAWLTREGWYYLAVLVFIIGGAILRSVNLLVILAGTMIAPLLFNWRLVMASLMGLEVRRQLPEQVLAGEPLTVEIEVRNPRPWMSSWLVTVEDWIEREAAAAGSQGTRDRGQVSGNRGQGTRDGSQMFKMARGWFPRRWQRNATRAQALIAHIPAGSIASGAYRVTLFRRGRYRFGPLRVSTRFPLGLVRGIFTLPQVGHLIVSPRLGRLLPQWANLLEAELLGDERRHPQRGASEGDYYGLRPWQTGDSLRWIHWRTTAKLARPVVRQYERRRGRDVALVLDPWLPRDGAEMNEARAELAISLTATAVHDICRRGHSTLTFASADREAPCFSGPASELFCQELLAQLADVIADAAGRLPDALQRATEAAPRGARLIVISSRAAGDPSLADCSAELPADADQLTWVDTTSPELGTLFVLDDT